MSRSSRAIKARTLRARAVFEQGAPENLRVAGQIDVATDGRMLTVVAESSNGDLTAELRAAGASEVELESLSLEEILVACLRRGGDTEKNHV